MERLSDSDEDEFRSPDENAQVNFTRDSIAISEMTEPAYFNELLPELFLLPNTEPPKYNVK